MDRLGLQRRENEDNPILGRRHVMHHPDIGRLDPAFLELLAVLVEEEVGEVVRGIAPCLISHGDELASVRIDLRVSGKRWSRVLSVEIV